MEISEESELVTTLRGQLNWFRTTALRGFSIEVKRRFSNWFSNSNTGNSGNYFSIKELSSIVKSLEGKPLW